MQQPVIAGRMNVARGVLRDLVQAAQGLHHAVTLVAPQRLRPQLVQAQQRRQQHN